MPAFLARRYAADSEVQRADDAPHVFTWRGRHYVVRSVLDHWWETAAWWTTQGTTQGMTTQDAVGDDERERWRVEAVTSGRSPVVMELCFAWRTGTWTVDTVMD